MDKRRKTLLIVLLVLFIILAGVGIGFLVTYWTSGNTDLSPFYQQSGHTTSAPTSPLDTSTPPTTTTTAVPLPDNPRDFAGLQAINPDIYGWLYIPGTADVPYTETGEIDYPLLCAWAEDDDFYLEHNIYKQYEFAGCIYSEKKNSRDMTDRNTVLYGHNMLNGTMFRNLHKFEDEAFFNEHDTFYIYIPGHILTYKIFAAYEYDNRHLLNTFDFSNDDVWTEYLAYATNPRSLNVNTRNVEVTTDDRIVTLSTCVGTNKKARYLVQGVLIDDQLTK